MGSAPVLCQRSEAVVPDPEEVRLTEIARAIESADSPVGIDAKKTHVLILRALERIEERVARLEAKLDVAAES